MDICILSMQEVNNMGSLLQSYALKKILEEMGHNIFFLEIKKIDADYELLGSYRMNFCKEQEKRGITGKLSKLDRYILNRLQIKQKYKNPNELFALFRRNNLCIDRVKEEYDVCIIGSDEVFNCLNAGYWGFSSQLFGNVPEAKKVITYAASCGATSYNMLPQPVADRICSAIKNISAISVRDDNTRDFVNHFIENRTWINLDPVLIYDFQREIEDAEIPFLPPKYCVVYSYINRIHEREEIDAICSFCESRNLVPVALGAPQFWCKRYIPCSPFECLKLFQNADCVITDTFHGTIMSAITRRQFVTVIRDSNRNKLRDLLSRLGLEDRECYEFNELKKIMSKPIDYKLVDEIREKESVRSRTYLNEAIES